MRHRQHAPVQWCCPDFALAEGWNFENCPRRLLRRLMAMIYDGLLVLAIVLTTTGLANPPLRSHAGVVESVFFAFWVR